MTVLFVRQDGFGVIVEAAPTRGPFPVIIQAPSSAKDRAPCMASPCPLQRVLSFPAIQSVKVVSPVEVHVEHDPLHGSTGEEERITLMTEVVRLLEAA